MQRRFMLLIVLAALIFISVGHQLRHLHQPEAGPAAAAHQEQEVPPPVQPEHGRSFTPPAAASKPAPPPRPVSSKLLEGAVVLFTQETKPTAADPSFQRITVYRTSFKHPFIRVVRQMSRDADGREIAGKESRMVADHLMVKVRKGVDAARLARHVAPLGASIRRQLGHQPLYLVALKNAEPSTFDEALRTWGKGDAVIEYAEPDYISQIGAAPVMPDDPQFSQQWNLHNTGGSGKTADADIDAPEAWSITTGSSSVLVAVIDSGIDLTHPDLAGNLWINPGESGGGKENDGIDNDANGYIDDVHGWNFTANTNSPDDDHGHGSHVAGTIGAVGGNATGIAGVCHSVRMMALKFLDATGSGTDSDAIEAITYATQNGAFASNNSWGGSEFTQSMQDAIAAADAAGVGFIAAAGNDGTNNDVIPNYPCNFPVPNIISVAATDYTDTLSWFSCYGSQTVHLGAPGFQTWSTSKDGGYEFMSGTSMAAPHVTGACALLKAATPALTFAQIKSMLVTQVDPLASMAGKSISGGRLNLAKALVPATAPLLQAGPLTVNDDPMSSTGNGDGVASPGESVHLVIPVTNLGATTATLVTGTLALKNADPEVVITQAAVSYGDIALNATAPGDSPMYGVNISAAKGTVDVPLVLTLTSGSSTWTQELVLRVRTVSTLSGTVVRMTGGTPIAGATIEITGAENHILQTNAAGGYSVALTNGSYSVRAAKDGYVPSAPVAVTMPSVPGVVNFALGISESTVTPVALSVTVQEGQSTTQSFTITNHGDVPMPYDILQVPPPAPPGSGTLAIASAPPEPVDERLLRAPPLPLQRRGLSRLRDASEDSVATLPWSEGFEDGQWGRWWASTTSGLREVVADTFAEGARSFHLNANAPDDGHLTGIEQWFAANPAAGHVSFWVKPGPRDLATSYMVLGDVYWYFDGSGFSLALADFIWFFANANGRFYLNDDVGGNQLVAFNEGQWYQIEFRNLNWTTRTFDYWVNGTLVQSGVPFRNPGLAAGLSVAFAYNYSTQTDSWWDEVKFFDDALPWARLSSSSGTLAPGESATITVTFDAARMKTGIHTGSLQVRTNDPVTPETTVALFMTVTDGTNQTPSAIPQSIVLSMDETRAIPLSGTDPDGNPLRCYITSLPAKGTLHQTADGVTPGNAITTTPKLVADPLNRVLFVPAAGESGSPYADFDFVVRDAEDDSPPATVTLHVASGPLLTLTPPGAASDAPVNVHLASSDPDAWIHYTTDGSTPTTSSSGFFGSGILRIDRSLTLKAIAFVSQGSSAMQSATFTLTDSDADGLPDWWETSSGGTITHAGPQDDPDGNGLTAMQEFICGIAPGDGAGFHASVTLGTSHTVTWFAALGRHYTVERSTRLTDWTPVSSPYLGTGTLMNFSTPPVPSPAFYRVRATLP